MDPRGGTEFTASTGSYRGFGLATWQDFLILTFYILYNLVILIHDQLLVSVQLYHADTALHTVHRCNYVDYMQLHYVCRCVIQAI